MTEPKGKCRQATIIDVARQAGVAVGTVSRYLNDQPIRGSNKDRIAEVIEQLGYRRNGAAASIKTRTTHMVGLLVPAVSEFHAALLDQLARRMRQTGRAVLCYCHDTDPGSIMDGIDFFAGHRVDAVIMDGNEQLRGRLDPYLAQGMLPVLYDNDLPGLPADRVFVENRRASRRLVEHLLDIGHERVAVIHGSLSDSVGHERLAGYRDALAAYGLAEDPALVIDGGWTEQLGYAAMGELMALSQPPTAVFGANYNMSVGALRWLREQAMSIPDDMSFVSFDDVPAFAMHTPGITAVAQPVAEIAEAIVSILGERLGPDRTADKQTIRIDADITLRGSTKRRQT